MTKTKKVLLIISLLLLVITFIFLLLYLVSGTEAKEKYDIAFKIATTVTLTMSLSISFTITINTFKDSFNVTTIYNYKNENLDKCWEYCYRINIQVESNVNLIEQKGIYNGNKEKDINDVMSDIYEAVDECKALICIYDGSHDITVDSKKRIDFINEYIRSLETIRALFPISFINTKVHNEKCEKILMVLKTIRDKYNITAKKLKEEK